MLFDTCTLRHPMLQTRLFKNVPQVGLKFLPMIDSRHLPYQFVSGECHLHA